MRATSRYVLLLGIELCSDTYVKQRDQSAMPRCNNGDAKRRKLRCERTTSAIGRENMRMMRRDQGAMQRDIVRGEGIIRLVHSRCHIHIKCGNP